MLKSFFFCAVGVFWTCVVFSTQLPPAPILEHYMVGHGETAGSPPFGLSARLDDTAFGGGGDRNSTKARVLFTTTEDAGILSMRIWRRVHPDDIVFALLVFRIEVQAYSSGGTLIDSRSLDGFTFGDSQSGYWAQRLSNLPSDTAQVQIIFVGNNE